MTIGEQNAHVTYIEFNGSRAHRRSAGRHEPELRGAVENNIRRDRWGRLRGEMRLRPSPVWSRRRG